MGNNGFKILGMTMGTVTVICGLLSIILGFAQPAWILMEWTLIDVIDDEKGIWMDEYGSTKIDSVDGYEIGDTCRGDGDRRGVMVSMTLIGATLIVFGFFFIVPHSNI